MLNEYTYSGIARAQALASDVINELYLKYSYEEYLLPCFKYYCRRYEIRQGGYLYQECFDASMLGYMYSICRCGIVADKNDVKHIRAYIWKVTGKYIIAAMVIAYDGKNICKMNGLKEVNVDSYLI